MKQSNTDDMVEVFTHTSEEENFEAAQNAGFETETNSVKSGVSTLVDLVVVDNGKTQE